LSRAWGIFFLKVPDGDFDQIAIRASKKSGWLEALVSDRPSTPVREFPFKMLVRDPQNTGTLNLEEWYTKDLPYTKPDWDIDQSLEFGSRDSISSIHSLSIATGKTTLNN
jgi:hypothetical protein